MTKLGQKLIHTLTEAIEGNFARVTIDGITWVRRDECRNQALEEAAKVAETTDSAGPWAWNLKIAAAIRVLKDKT